MTATTPSQAATGPQAKRQARSKRSRPHPKTMQDVWCGVSRWGKSCGHQHLSRQGAVNCLNGGDHGPELADPQARVDHLGPGPRRQLLST